MQNAICFSTKFGWITATEQKNKVTSIRFKKSSKQGKTSFLLNKLKSNIFDLWSKDVLHILHNH